MPDNILLLKEILQYLETYQQEVGNADIKEFSIYLRDQVISPNDKHSGLEFDKNNYKNYKSYKEVEFSTLLTGLFRFAKHYIKKALANTSFKTIDEFGFLATLLREESLLKNELIHKHHLEISSGSEIIKRLVRNELILEYPDEKDKRAKRVALTPIGRKEILSAFDEMHQVSEIIIGNLSPSEIDQSLAAFNKLTYFHQHIYEEDRNTDLKQLHHKYIENSKD